LKCVSPLIEETRKIAITFPTSSQKDHLHLDMERGLALQLARTLHLLLTIRKHNFQTFQGQKHIVLVDLEKLIQNVSQKVEIIRIEVFLALVLIMLPILLGSVLGDTQ
jgi:hypothetical protein